MKVFDAHWHIFPAIIAHQSVQTISRAYPHTGEAPIGRAQTASQAHSHTDEAPLGTVQNLLANNADITMHLVHSVALTQKQVSSVNSFIARKTAQFPDKLLGFGTLHPDSGSEDIAQLHHLGFQGIKLHPDIQKFSLNDPRFYRLCEELEDKFLLLLHTGDRRNAFSNPEQLEPLLKRFPNTKFIAAHFGGHGIWQEAAHKLAGKYQNLWVDCSSSFYALTKKEAKDLIHAYSPSRVLFGSDYPLRSPKEELQTLLSLSLPPEETHSILWSTAAHLLTLP